MESQDVPPGGDKTTGPVYVAVSGLFLSIACVLVGLRLYVRAQMVRKLWWDDFFHLLGVVRLPITIALLWANCTELSSIVSFGLTFASIKFGFGRHIYYLSPEQAIFALKLQSISMPFFILSLLFTKISICLLLMRIFVTNRVKNYQVWKRAIYIIMSLLVTTSLSSIIFALAQCNPIAKSWNPTISGTCWSRDIRIALYYYQGGKTAENTPFFNTPSHD